MRGKVLTFRLCGSLFGMDIGFVKECTRRIDYTIVPAVPSEIVGLLNLRGQVVTLFDLAQLVKYKTDYQNRWTGCIILKANPKEPTNRVGFLIEKMGEVLDLSQDIYEGVSVNSKDIEAESVLEAVKLPEEILLLIHSEKIFGL